MEVKEYWCKTCKEQVESGHTRVEGEGATPARFLVLGEAPGAAEVEKGRPFIGQSGRLLRTVLRSFGGTQLLSDCYFTNAVRTKVTGTPGMPHLRKCRDGCLQTTIELVQPEAILCLGIAGLKALTDDGNIPLTTSRREVFEYTPSWEGASPIPVMVTWTGGHVLKNPDAEDWWKSDLYAFFIEEAYKREPFEVTWRARSNLPASVAKATDVTLDVETTGFDPWEGHKLRVVGVSTGSVVTVVDGEAVEDFRELLDNPECRIHGANVMFDLLWLIGDREIPLCKGVDVQYLHYLLDERYPNRRLKHLHSLYTNWEQYDIGMGGVDQEDLTIVSDYCAKDVKTTEVIEPLILGEMHDEGTDYSRAAAVMEDVVPVLAGMTRTGIAVDREMLERIAATEKEKWIASADGMKKVWERHKDEEWDISILNRYADLSDFLYGTLAIPVPKIDKPYRQDGKPSTAKAALQYIQKNGTDPTGFVDALFEYRAVHENYKKYVLDILKRTDDNGRIHPRYNFKTTDMGGTVTGRLSVSKPALQNTPGDHPMRYSFVPLPGDTHLWQMDLSTIELTVLAQISQDAELLKVLSGGEDLHQWAADTATNIGFPMSRKMAKIINFGILYGIGAGGLAMQTTLSKEGAKAVQAAWFRRFSNVNRFKQNIEYSALNRGWVEAPYGQRRHFPTGIKKFSALGGRIQRQAFNFVIQSTANMLNLMMLGDFARNGGLEHGFPVAVIHDAIIISTNDVRGLEAWWENYFANTLEANYSWLIDQEITLPVRAEAQAGVNWAEMQPSREFISGNRVGKVG